MKTYLLLQAMNDNGVSREMLAKHLGIAYNTLLLKLRGKGVFTVPEARNIKEYLHLTDDEFVNIFFNEEVA